jgi:hypothetical protein
VLAHERLTARRLVVAGLAPDQQAAQLALALIGQSEGRQLGRASHVSVAVLLFQFQIILTREFEDSPQRHERFFTGSDGSLGITIHLHPRYQIDLLGHPPFAFGDMELSL